jgi:hypothetical protein
MSYSDSTHFCGFKTHIIYLKHIIKGQTLIGLNKTGKADVLADGRTDLNQKLKLNLAGTCCPSRMGVGFRF